VIGACKLFRGTGGMHTYGETCNQGVANCAARPVDSDDIETLGSIVITLTGVGPEYFAETSMCNDHSPR